jgi:transposase
MTGSIDRVEVITSVQRRRRWSADEKARIVQETYGPGMSVSLVARQHGIAPNQVFSWRRLYAEGALSAVGAGEEVVPASEYRALQHVVSERRRCREEIGRRHVVIAVQACSNGSGKPLTGPIDRAVID